MLKAFFAAMALFCGIIPAGCKKPTPSPPARIYKAAEIIGVWKTGSVRSEYSSQEVTLNLDGSFTQSIFTSSNTSQPNWTFTGNWNLTGNSLTMNDWRGWFGGQWTPFILTFRLHPKPTDPKGVVLIGGPGLDPDMDQEWVRLK